MQPQEFYIPTTWRIKGTAERVYDVLSKPAEFPHWWPEVYLAVSDEGLPRELARQAAL